MKQFIFIIMLIIGNLLAGSVNAEVNVSIDRSPVRLNESFQIIFETDSSPDREPDFSGLQQHFVVLNRSQSNNITIVNGEYKRNLRWVLQVMPKQVGDFIIPAIPFGSEKTRPFQVTVKPANQAGAGAQDGLIFELSVDKSTTYVQGQVVVTLRLMVDRNISGYQMSELKIKNLDVVVETLGEVKQYQTRLADKDYLVLEKQVALFPQQSGVLEIEPVVAEVQMSQRALSLFGAFPDGSNIRRILSEGASIEVQTVPTESSAIYWLPASSMTITEDWQGDIAQLVAGEPVTRTITLVGAGLTSAQLPELPETKVDGIKLYPDQPLLQDRKTAAGIVGTRQQKIALIPTEPGIYTLPEITIPWWNVTTGEQELAHIPSRTIEVKAGVDIGQFELSDQNGSSENVINYSSDRSLHQREANTFWVWLSLLLALGWAVTGLFWWYEKYRKSGHRVAPEKPKEMSLQEALKSLTQSCVSDDARGAREALLVWANALVEQQSFENLNQLGTFFGDEMQIKLNELNRSLYDDESTQWKGDQLQRVCESISAHYKEKKTADHSDRLCALNP